jgi:hypothetical protein
MLWKEKESTVMAKTQKPNVANAKPASSGNANVFAYISFFVAALSLVATIYQSYLNTRYVELIQTSVARAETARTCKDLIDAYFQIKFKTGAVAAAVEREKNPNSPAVIAVSSEALNSVSRFAAFGTYLANFQGEERRVQYTALSNELRRIVDLAHSAPASSIEKLFDKADQLFGTMNDDCVRSAMTRL